MTTQAQLYQALLALFPSGVHCAAGLILGCPEAACPLERAQTATAGARRRQEYAAGRHYARLALRQAGASGKSLINGEEGAPQWPPGFTGSISHTGTLCAAAAGSTTRFRGLGLDIERQGRIGSNLWKKLFTPREQALLGALDAEPRDLLSTQLFCAKEAFYKAQHPLTGLWLGFLDVDIEPDFETNSFRVRCPTCDAQGLRAAEALGRLACTAGIALAGVCLPQHP